MGNDHPRPKSRSKRRRTARDIADDILHLHPQLVGLPPPFMIGGPAYPDPTLNYDPHSPRPASSPSPTLSAIKASYATRKSLGQAQNTRLCSFLNLNGDAVIGSAVAGGNKPTASGAANLEAAELQRLWLPGPGRYLLGFDSNRRLMMLNYEDIGREIVSLRRADREKAAKTAASGGRRAGGNSVGSEGGTDGTVKRKTVPSAPGAAPAAIAANGKKEEDDSSDASGSAENNGPNKRRRKGKEIAEDMHLENDQTPPPATGAHSGAAVTPSPSSSTPTATISDEAAPPTLASEQPMGVFLDVILGPDGIPIAQLEGSETNHIYEELRQLWGGPAIYRVSVSSEKTLDLPRSGTFDVLHDDFVTFYLIEETESDEAEKEEEKNNTAPAEKQRGKGSELVPNVKGVRREAHFLFNWNVDPLRMFIDCNRFMGMSFSDFTGSQHSLMRHIRIDSTNTIAIGDPASSLLTIDLTKEEEKDKKEVEAKAASKSEEEELVDDLEKAFRSFEDTLEPPDECTCYRSRRSGFPWMDDWDDSDDWDSDEDCECEPVGDFELVESAVENIIEHVEDLVSSENEYPTVIHFLCQALSCYHKNRLLNANHFVDYKVEALGLCRWAFRVMVGVGHREETLRRWTKEEEDEEREDFEHIFDQELEEKTKEAEKEKEKVEGSTTDDAQTKTTEMKPLVNNQNKEEFVAQKMKEREKTDYQEDLEKLLEAKAEMFMLGEWIAKFGELDQCEPMEKLQKATKLLLKGEPLTDEQCKEHPLFWLAEWEIYRVTGNWELALYVAHKLNKPDLIATSLVQLGRLDEAIRDYLQKIEEPGVLLSIGSDMIHRPYPNNIVGCFLLLREIDLNRNLDPRDRSGSYNELKATQHSRILSSMRMIFSHFSKAASPEPTQQEPVPKLVTLALQASADALAKQDLVALQKTVTTIPEEVCESLVFEMSIRQFAQLQMRSLKEWLVDLLVEKQLTGHAVNVAITFFDEEFCQDAPKWSQKLLGWAKTYNQAKRVVDAICRCTSMRVPERLFEIAKDIEAKQNKALYVLAVQLGISCLAYLRTDTARSHLSSIMRPGLKVGDVLKWVIDLSALIDNAEEKKQCEQMMGEQIDLINDRSIILEFAKAMLARQSYGVCLQAAKKAFTLSIAKNDREEMATWLIDLAEKVDQAEINNVVAVIGESINCPRILTSLVVRMLSRKENSNALKLGLQALNAAPADDTAKWLLDVATSLGSNGIDELVQVCIEQGKNKPPLIMLAKKLISLQQLGHAYRLLERCVLLRGSDEVTAAQMFFDVTCEKLPDKLEHTVKVLADNIFDSALLSQFATTLFLDPARVNLAMRIGLAAVRVDNRRTRMGSDLNKLLVAHAANQGQQGLDTLVAEYVKSNNFESVEQFYRLLQQQAESAGQPAPMDVEQEKGARKGKGIRRSRSNGAQAGPSTSDAVLEYFASMLATGKRLVTLSTDDRKVELTKRVVDYVVNNAPNVEESLKEVFDVIKVLKSIPILFELAKYFQSLNLKTKANFTLSVLQIIIDKFTDTDFTDIKQDAVINWALDLRREKGREQMEELVAKISKASNIAAPALGAVAVHLHEVKENDLALSIAIRALQLGDEERSAWTIGLAREGGNGKDDIKRVVEVILSIPVTNGAHLFEAAKKLYEDKSDQEKAFDVAAKALKQPGEERADIGIWILEHKGMGALELCTKGLYKPADVLRLAQYLALQGRNLQAATLVEETLMRFFAAEDMFAKDRRACAIWLMQHLSNTAPHQVSRVFQMCLDRLHRNDLFSFAKKLIAAYPDLGMRAGEYILDRMTPADAASTPAEIEQLRKVCDWMLDWAIRLKFDSEKVKTLARKMSACVHSIPSAMNLARKVHQLFLDTKWDSLRDTLSMLVDKCVVIERTYAGPQVDDFEWLLANVALQPPPSMILAQKISSVIFKRQTTLANYQRMKGYFTSYEWMDEKSKVMQKLTPSVEAMQILLFENMTKEAIDLAKLAPETVKVSLVISLTDEILTKLPDELPNVLPIVEDVIWKRCWKANEGRSYWRHYFLGSQGVPAAGQTPGAPAAAQGPSTSSSEDDFQKLNDLLTRIGKVSPEFKKRLAPVLGLIIELNKLEMRSGNKASYERFAHNMGPLYHHYAENNRLVEWQQQVAAVKGGERGGWKALHNIVNAMIATEEEKYQKFLLQKQQRELTQMLSSSGNHARTV